MKKRTVFILPFVILLFSLSSGDLHALEVAVIVNKTNPHEISEMDEIRSVFLGEIRSWESGTPIQIFIQDDEELNKQFCRLFLKKTPRQFELSWRKLLFTGNVAPPLPLQDDMEVIEAVKRNPTAIGYVSLKSCNDSVRVLSIR